MGARAAASKTREDIAEETGRSEPKVTENQTIDTDETP